MRFINIIFVALLLSACAAAVNVDYDYDVNFKSYKSYSNVIKAVRISNDTRINSPFMQQRVVDAIKTTLTKNGYNLSENDASLQVKYYLDIKQELETQESSMMMGFGTSSYHSAIGVGFNIPIGETTSFDRLVLTIDMVSTKTNKLIWRGSSGYYLSEEGTPEKYEEMIQDLVTVILEKYPPQ